MNDTRPSRATPAWQSSTLRGITITVVVSALLAMPPTVMADAFSAQVYRMNHTPTGEINTDYCSRAGIVDTARNSSQVLAYAGGGAHDCLGTVNQVPAGWIATKATGYRDGAQCATSSYYYNTSAASNWMLWITLCSNPSGPQEFKTSSWIKAYDGAGFYWEACCWPVSPIAVY
jgi:hypothetical protein